MTDDPLRRQVQAGPTTMETTMTQALGTHLLHHTQKMQIHLVLPRAPAGVLVSGQELLLVLRVLRYSTIVDRTSRRQRGRDKRRMIGRGIGERDRLGCVTLTIVARVLLTLGR